MGQPKPYLIAGGAISALISIFHLMLALNPTLYKFISPGQESVLAQMALAGSSLTTFATLALTLMFAIWAIYAFSGAEWIGRLPVLRAALVVIGGIYILRALFLPSEIRMVLTHRYPFRAVVLSTVSLVVGLLNPFGTFKSKAA